MNFDNLGVRMKEYEDISRIKLTRRSPIIIRLDGKAFHTFTKGFERPFDLVFAKAMQETCIYLCENIMNCQLAYTQSDEISLLLIDYNGKDAQAWFNSNIQKMASVSASMATLAFNNAFRKIASNIADPNAIYKKKLDTALFDSRVFVLPKEEVCNYFIWRQQDATRNSILMAAQTMLSFKEMQGVKSNELQEIMWQRFNVNWNDYPIPQKRGCCIEKVLYEKNGSQRSRWQVDEDTPIFTQEREYIDSYVGLVIAENSLSSVGEKSLPLDGGI